MLWEASTDNLTSLTLQTVHDTRFLLVELCCEGRSVSFKRRAKRSLTNRPDLVDIGVRGLTHRLALDVGFIEVDLHSAQHDLLKSGSSVVGVACGMEESAENHSGTTSRLTCSLGHRKGDKDRASAKLSGLQVSCESRGRNSEDHNLRQARPGRHQPASCHDE